jgi:stage V sporulation protein G
MRPIPPNGHAHYASQDRSIGGDRGKLVAYAEITIDDCFLVRDLKISHRPPGYYITIPQVKLKNGKYKVIAFATDAGMRKMIEDAVIAEYEKLAGKGSRLP